MCLKLKNFKFGVVVCVLSLQMHIILGHVLTTTTTEATKFRFEGVDYFQLPDNLKILNYDCYTINMECIRHYPNLNPVCAYRILSHQYNDYFNLCEVELENCLYRIHHNVDNYYGQASYDNKVFFNGENYKCEFYARMGEDMDEAYFGMASRELDEVKTDILRSMIKEKMPNNELVSTASLVKMTGDFANTTVGSIM
ncbi:uncharacterized protein LOC116412833 [Galleria mellonella]|uniref:Uncharacterized protein LOC116412833 n=1 Tax=Galleria mellonella TaxID=7137 RepID=A0A6J3BWE1_GALME|nr:uncharacterized protein LOC116412833 [Galleria mellonella]